MNTDPDILPASLLSSLLVALHWVDESLQARLEAIDTPGSSVAGLTARELEVLGCLARGQSNRAIADALYLAPKTIEHHLTSIYTKLRVENRAQAAAFAVRHGLT